jgi:hypothetical protein
MSEYVTVESRPTDNPDVLEILTNQTLAEGETEVYNTPEAGDEGSPLAQTLFGVDGIRALTITETTLLITRDPDVTWEDIIDEVRDALRDFFL